MSRPLRIEFAGALYHVTARGDRREAIFEDDEDRVALLDVVGHALERFDAVAFAYCLMGNHYHFVLQTRGANLSRVMRQINGVYTQRFNARHRKVGHLFQGRFKAILVDADAYFLEVCRYVDLNPVRAAMVRRPQDWPWSSYRAHAGLEGGPSWLDAAQLHRQLAPRAPRREGPQRYAAFVREGRGVRLWEEALHGQIFLGSEAFAERMRGKLEREPAPEVPRLQRLAAPRPLEEYLKNAAEDRDAGIYSAFRDGRHTQAAIASALGLSGSRISRIIKAREAASRNAAA